VETIHARGWMYGLLISLLLDIYKLNQTNTKLKAPKDAKEKASLEEYGFLPAPLPPSNSPTSCLKLKTLFFFL